MPQKKLQKVLELNFKKDALIKVSPIGDITGFDGRVFQIDGKALLASISQNSVHIPLDENHGFGEALGWFDKESFELKEDGIYAKLELNPKGDELVSNRSYRYLSPVFEMGTGQNVVGLDSVGLVNRPNLLNKELNNKDKKLDETQSKALLDKFEALLVEVKGLKDEIVALKKDAGASTNQQNNKDIKEDVTAIGNALKEMNKKLAVFGKTNLEENKKKPELSANDKKVASLLGISEDEYLASKESK